MVVINLREGRTGRSESVFAITIAMLLSGLFAFESSYAYGSGNSTYLSLPIACLIAFGVFSIAAVAMRKSKASDLHDLVVSGLGKAMSVIVCLVVVFVLVICISSLLNKFLNIMHSFFYQESSYYNIALYMLIVMPILACMGFETISRVAKIVGILLIITQVLLLVNSISGYESYKLYPIAGDGGRHMTEFAFACVFNFMPALTVALISSKGMHGIVNTSRNVRKSVIISIIVCAVVQVFLGLTFTYESLAKLYMPLYRMSMVTGEENFLVRLDKISAFVWFGGALLAGSFYLYGASLLYCRTFKQLDIRPTACTLGLLAILFCLLSHSGGHVAYGILNFLNKYGFLFACVPIVVVSLMAILRSNIKEKRKCKGQ